MKKDKMLKEKETQKSIVVIDRYTNKIFKKIDINDEPISITVPVLKDKEDNNKKLINTEFRIYYKDKNTNKQENIKIDAIYYTALLVDINKENIIIQFMPLNDENLFIQMVNSILTEEGKIELTLTQFNGLIIIDKNKNLQFFQNGKLLNEIKYKEHEFENFLEKNLFSDKYFKMYLIDKFFAILNKKMNTLSQ